MREPPGKSPMQAQPGPTASGLPSGLCGHLQLGVQALRFALRLAGAEETRVQPKRAAGGRGNCSPCWERGGGKEYQGRAVRGRGGE